MTMIDEGVLSAALRATGDAFDVSDAAAERIVDQMRVEDEHPLASRDSCTSPDEPATYS